MDSMEEIYKKHGKMIYGYVPQAGGKPYFRADWGNHGAQRELGKSNLLPRERESR